MFAYCGNDPVNREDSSGYLWGFIKTFISEIANVFNAFRPIYAVAGGAILVDGSLPIGDLVGLVIASVATIAVVGIATYNSITYSSKSDSEVSKKSTTKKRSQPKLEGEPNSREVIRGSNGEIEKYTEFGPNGEFKKEVRLTGKEHGSIPRPNVKEPNYNVNPKTGQNFQNGFRVRAAKPEEINIKWDVK